MCYINVWNRKNQQYLSTNYGDGAWKRISIVLHFVSSEINPSVTFSFYITTANNNPWYAWRMTYMCVYVKPIKYDIFSLFLGEICTLHFASNASSSEVTQWYHRYGICDMREKIYPANLSCLIYPKYWKKNHPFDDERMNCSITESSRASIISRWDIF
jgi:hypothetical protein